MYPFPELLFLFYMILHGQSDEYIWAWVIWSEGHDHFWRQISKPISFQLNCNYMFDLDLTSQGHSSPKPMAPFERASMTSYSTIMVTVDLSASVSKLQPSEICLTSILTSPGHPRSKPMAPFERASMTSYSTLMVTMELSASVSKLQPSEICVTSILTSQGHSRSRPMPPFERASMTSYSTLMVTMPLSASISK